MDNIDINRLLDQARIEIDRGGLSIARKILKPLVVKKVPEALFLASMIQMSKSETRDQFHARSIEFLSQAAQLGHAGAMYSLAVCYENGDMVNEDCNLAGAYFENAAKNGYGKAKLSHGLNLYYGSHGRLQNKSLGLRYIQEAAEEGIEGAEEALHQLEPSEGQPSQGGHD